LLMPPPPPRSPLFPYTTLFRSYDLEVPVLLFTSLVNPKTATARPGGVHPMSISWEDAGLAVRRALETPELPSPFERVHIVADLRSEEHTSELQSPYDLVCRLLL